MIHYKIQPKNLGSHLLNVAIEFNTNKSEVIMKLPKWIPGSYKIRDYSKHLLNIVANGNTDISLQKIDSCSWKISSLNELGKVIISYDVYAYDLSVRGAYLDDTRMFFNHCCVFLDINEFSNLPRTIDIKSVDDWEIFTELKRNGEFFFANNYFEQIDCPVESAKNILLTEQNIEGIPHKMLFTGTISDKFDTKRTINLVASICNAQMKLFKGSPIDDKYLFMTYLEQNQYGGLEHKNSTALMASPEMIIKKEQGKELTEKQIDFLGLCSHEYFHLWNIKRLKPTDLMPYNLYQEQNTEMLWMFEGFTSYYDELMLLRANIVSKQVFLDRQAKNISRVLSTPARFIQSIAESSFDAWTKLYQADENANNSIISYYAKGAFFALFLDLWIRKNSNNEYSLDDVMLNLWQNYGKKDTGIDEDIIFSCCAELIPQNLHEKLATVFITGIHGYEDLDLISLLEDFLITSTFSPEHTNKIENTSNIGFMTKKVGSKTIIYNLDTNHNAAQKGLSNNDELIAINNLDISSFDIAEVMNLSTAGDNVKLTVSRRGRVFEKSITLEKPKQSKLLLKIEPDNKNELQQKWLLNNV